MPYRLAELLDIPELQALLDCLYRSSNIPSAIVDVDGEILTGSGWQDVCTKFHRIHPDAEKRCIESDRYITRHIKDANPSVVYKCPHGLVDAATPIVVEGAHLGNVFTGQLLFEEPDLDSFRAQARTYGFDEARYIEAVKKVPVISEEAIEKNLAFLAQFTQMLAEMGLKKKTEMETERQLRESEERLRKSQYLLETLVEGTSDAVYIKDVRGRYLLFNAAASRFMGKSAPEVIGKDDTFLFPSAEADAVMEGDRSVMKSGTTMTYEEYVTAASGKKVTFLSTKGPLVDQKGNVIGIFGIARDITENKQAEQKLRESEDRYRDLVEHSQDLICTHDLDGRLLSLNPLPAKILGYSRDELLNTDMRDLIPPEFHEEYDRYLETVRKNGDAQGTMIVVARNGERRIWEYHNTLRTEGVKNPIVRGMARDITERKRAEKALRDATRRLQLAATSGRLGIWEWDLRSDALYWDERMYELYGVPRGTSRKGLETWQKSLHPDDFAAVTEAARAAISGEKEFDTEFRVVHPDGTVKFLQANAVLLRDAEGKALRMIGINRDITHRKQAESEMGKLHAQLQQAQKMEAVGRLAGGIAHDFNNLLTVINGYSGLLLAQLEERSPQYREAEEIKRAGERAAALTRQLLAFSRKQVLQPKVLDLNNVVSGMGGMLRRLIGEDIDFRSVLEKGLGMVRADPGQIEQVIVNLVVNSRDAMPGGGKLRIATANFLPNEAFLREHPSAVPGPHVCLTVSDTGTGMSEEAKSHMFEPFFTTKEKGKGTGLGLSTVYGIVNQSGGHISIGSDIGKGTTVSVYLPCVEEEAERLPEVADAGLYGREWLLVVEDEDAVRGIVERVLAEKGYRVLSAGDGNEGLRLFEAHKESIDLLITDVVMPGMGGRDLASRVEAARPGMKVLYMSGYTDEAINRHGVLDAGLSFLQKPFTPVELLEKVREILNKSSLH